MAESVDLAEMEANSTDLIPHPAGELPPVEELSATADTFGGRVQVEWDPAAPVTPLGQLPFFIDFLICRVRHIKNYAERRTMPNRRVFPRIHAYPLLIHSA